MDALTHSLLGVTLAKAGLERWSPYTAAVCVLSANAPDIDVVSGFFGDRWTVLQYHRGITHSIVDTFTLGILIPSIFWAMERAIAKWRRRRPRIRYRGLLLASLIAAATHPLMDWTNNYGLRPLLPWNGRWVYGGLVFSVDPYIWLALGGAAFLLTSNRWPKILAWSVLGVGLTLFVFLAPAQRALGPVNLNVVRIIWVIGILSIAFGRVIGFEKRFGKLIPRIVLILVVWFLGGVGWRDQAGLRGGHQLA